ncbi:MAG: D-Ala-D-Ala carboxypeptidase family metallohydrolase, partial [candidate division WOR-3 bacterium]
LGRYPTTTVFPKLQRPRGFIEVTGQNINTPVSPRYTIADFTSGHPARFPYYIALREDLVRKLELLTDLVQAKGHQCDKLTVMSGFRSRANRRRGSGRNSAHYYGGAADVFVDSNHDARMDDLNHDGEINRKDAQLLVSYVDELEERHPELAGGAGWYRRTRSHGPFIHMDVRGERIRWHR